MRLLPSRHGGGLCTTLTRASCAARYGFHATSNSYFISRDPAVTNRIFSLLRFGNPDTVRRSRSIKPPFSAPAHPAHLSQDSSTASPSSLKLPTSLAGYALTTIRDLTVGFDSGNPPSFEPKLPVDRSAHMISFALGSVEDGKGDGDGVEVVGTVRTSGTEPKVRCCASPPGRSDPSAWLTIASVVFPSRSSSTSRRAGRTALRCGQSSTRCARHSGLSG